MPGTTTDAPNSQKPTVTRASGRGGHLVKVTGVIDERFDRKSIFDGLSGVVVFDLDGVHKITSYGVREWMAGLKQLRADYCCFVNVRPALVLQFNMIENFAAGGQLLSFYAPYVCPSCGEETVSLLDLRTQLQAVKNAQLPEVPCPKCGAKAEFDEIPDSYFAYVASAPDPTPPPQVAALLNGTAFAAAAGPKAPFKIEKAISGELTTLRFIGELDRAVRFKRVADGLEGAVLIRADKVTAVTREGLESLKGLLSTPTASIYLHRVPMVLATPLLADPELLGPARLLSVLVDCVCTDCRTDSQLDMDEAGRDALLQSLATCPSCGHPTLKARSGGELSLLKAAHLATAPAAIASFLADQPKQQTEAGEEQEPAGTPFGRYTLLRLIGTGGMAEVFVARQTAMAGFEKKIVVKRILPALSSDEGFIHMFLQEARVAAKISHPNVVQIFDLGQVGAQYFIAMEYVKGWDLNAILRLCMRLDKPFPAPLAMRVVADICAGLHAAHACVGDDGRPTPIAHRDVSPHNVLVSMSGQVKLTDFGIAKAVDAGESTPTTSLKGKISYMAPELLNPDFGAPDHRADIFPCGVILYLALTLEHLFRREGDYATLKAILHDPVPRLTDRRPDVPPQLQQVLEKSLERRPENRYASAARMKEDLEAILSQQGQRVGPEQLSEWLRGLVKQAENLGQLPPDMSAMAFTPTTGNTGVRRVSRPAQEQDEDKTPPTGSGVKLPII